jgi:putative DNA primase/helicase
LAYGSCWSTKKIGAATLERPAPKEVNISSSIITQPNGSSNGHSPVVLIPIAQVEPESEPAAIDAKADANAAISQMATIDSKRDAHAILRHFVIALCFAGVSLESAKLLIARAITELNRNPGFRVLDNEPLNVDETMTSFQGVYPLWLTSAAKEESSVAIPFLLTDSDKPAKQPCETEAHTQAVSRHKLRADVKDLRKITADTWKCIEARNQPPVLFRHGDIVSRVEKNDSGSPVLREMTKDRMCGFLADIIRWQRETKQDGLIDALPPPHVVKNILATPNIPLPVLERITYAPVFAPNGELQTGAGYNAATRCLYYPRPGFVLPPVPERPTMDDIRRARELICEPFLDFPFVGEAELAHTIAAVLLPFALTFIDGPTPLHLIEKPSPGTGATLLTNIIGSIIAGENPALMTEASDDKDWRQRITSTLLEGPCIVFIDNIKRKLDSGSLSAALTATYWKDRILGLSKNATLPIRCLWLASGNNPILSHEIARRVVRIRIEAPGATPWLGRTFKHPKVEEWVSEHRGELVWAVLTLIRAWLAQGRTKGTQVLGMFDSWSHVIGGILDSAEIPGFLTNLAELYESSDVEVSYWGEFTAAWWDAYKGQAVGVTDLFSLAVNALLNLGEGNEQSQKVRLGNQLKRMKDRQFEGYRIVKGGTLHGAQQWSLAPVEGSA